VWHTVLETAPHTEVAVKPLIKDDYKLYEQLHKFTGKNHSYPL
jgi:hypothetical protein